MSSSMLELRVMSDWARSIRVMSGCQETQWVMSESAILEAALWD
jgi:hypothetical protein